jgi:hypothetical protein
MAANVKDLERYAEDGNWTKFLTAYYDVYKDRDKNKPLTQINQEANETFSAYQNGGKGKGGGAGLGQGFGNMVSKFAGSQQSGQYYTDISKSVTVDNAVSAFTGKAGGLATPDELALKLVSAGVNEISNEYQNQTKLLEDINTKTSLTGKLSEDFRNQISNAGVDLVKLGISFDTVAISATRLLETTGRFNVLNQETLYDVGKIGQAFLGDMSKMMEMIPEFEKVGIGAKSTIDAVQRTGQRSLELGLSSKKVAESLQTNIGMLNQYGFQKGVDGLARMVQKSIEFKTSMEATAAVAEKVFSPEGALELSANLQVLGGAIGDFNDPLKLMYMATNNVEGLQDALIDAAGSLATYNQEQGRFEVTGVNLRKVREMANALGVDYKELTKTAIATQERLSSAQMLSGLTIEEGDKEFLTNLAQMKDGKMSIAINSEELRRQFDGANSVALDQIDDRQAKLLLEYREQFKEMSPEDIVRGQATNIENIRRDVSYLVKAAALAAGREGKELFNKLVDLGKVADITKEAVPKLAAAVTNEIKGLSNVLDKDKQKGKVEAPKTTVTQEQAKKMAQEEVEKKQKEASVDKTITVKNEYEFKGGATLVDGWMRETVKNSSIYNDFIVTDSKEYTQPSTAKK